MKKINLEKDYNKLIVEIAGFTYVTVDNWNDGELGQVNEWELEKTYLELNTLNKKAFKEIKKAILERLNQELYKDITTRYFNKYVCDNIIDNRVCWSQYTNEDNSWEPTKKEYRDFKKGLKDLFIQNINISVKINGERVSEQDLYTILKTK